MAKNVVTLNLDNTDYSFRPYGTCSTSASTAAKVVSITGFTLCEGATVLVKFENNNTALYPTLNINNTGAKSVIGGNLTSGGIYEFMYDGTYWNIIKSDSSKNYHVIDLTSLSQDNFYPVIFNAKHYVNDCEIHSPNVAGTSAYNQNILHFQLHACGYSDTPKSFKVLSYGTYSSSEITIGAVGYGTTAGEHCVWVRGGMKYEFICNIKPVLYADGYSSLEQAFMPGTNYHGGTNAKVTICWSADNPRSEVLSEAATSTKLGGIKTGYTQSGKNYPVQLDANNKAFVNVPWTDTNTDTKVTQNVTTSNANYPLLLAPSDQTATTTGQSYFDSGVTLNPSTNTIAANISGNAATATNATNVNIITSSSSGDYPLLFTSNVTAGNKRIYTDTENVLSYNPYTNVLKTKIIEARADSSSNSLIGTALKLYNSGWVTNMQTAMDFYNGSSYTVPNARISVLMSGDGKAGGTMIFSTQSKHASTNPNPNGLTERMRISDTDNGSITITSTGETPLCVKGGTGSWIRFSDDKNQSHLGYFGFDTSRTPKVYIENSGYNLLYSNNYTDYTVKKDGTGASGTWPISISGNAATANSATTATNASKLNDWTRTDIQVNTNSNAHILFDTTPMIINGVNLHDTNCKLVTAPDNNAPFKKVWLCTEYTSWYSSSDKFIYVTPGDTICVESWIMRKSGATGTAGAYYLGLQFRDKNGNNVNDNAGTIYMSSASNWTCPTDGVWYRRFNEYTIPKSHTAYNGSDGGSYYTAQIRLLINHGGGTIPTYFGGFRIYKRIMAKTDETGGVKVAGTRTTAITTTQGGTTSSRYYGVEIDSTGKAFVNVPWTDTNTDTKNTTGATNSASKMYLIGATSQDANPQTYSNSNVYATNGDLVANSFQGSIKGTSADNVNTAYKDLHFRFYNNVSGCDSTVSTDGKRYAGTANSYGFPVSNNANAMLWIGAHSGNYGHQLGFSSDGRIYDRYISNGSFPTTVNGGSWKKIAFTSDIETATTAEITALFN